MIRMWPFLVMALAAVSRTRTQISDLVDVPEESFRLAIQRADADSRAGNVKQATALGFRMKSPASFKPRRWYSIA